jgi:hypothetical protein
MTASIASEHPWPAIAPALEPATGAHARPAGNARPRRSRLGMLDDAALLLLIALLFPVLILLVGVPVALLLRLVVAIAQLL